MAVTHTAMETSSHRSHFIHGSQRIWNETNCSVDVWVELLHLLGLDPVAGLAFVLESDFDGSQWTFIKYPTEDLRRIYGIDVAELNVWRGVGDHVEEQLGQGNLLTVEVDAWYLPDTASTSYHQQHTKTTIVPVGFDRASERVGYLHGTGLYEATGPDFRGVFRLDDGPDDDHLPPYVELVRIDGRATQPDEALVTQLVREHLDRRPKDDPAQRLADRLSGDVGWVQEAGTDAFHKWAFGTIRQFGAAAELAGDVADRVATGRADLGDVGDMFRRAAETARTVQLLFARAARGRRAAVEAPLAAMAGDWRDAVDALAVGVPET